MSWQERMNKAVSYIESELDGNIDMEHIQEIVGQSCDGFARTFSAVAGMTVAEYIRRRRMAIAAMELKSGNDRVLDIALRCGYDSPESFARAFRDTYGISPTEARRDKPLLEDFPRLSFQLNVVKDAVSKTPSTPCNAEVVKVFRQYMPALSLIGKKYTVADLDPNYSFQSKWNEWFQNGWFWALGKMGCLAGYDNTVIFAEHFGKQAEWWIGMFFPIGTNVPQGFESIDLPEGEAGICYLRSNNIGGELFSKNAEELCLKKLNELGYTPVQTLDNTPDCWRFERYDNERYKVPDSQGRIILDKGFYIIPCTTAREYDLLCAEEIQHQEQIAAEATEMNLDRVHFVQTKEYSVAEYSTDDLMFCALTLLVLKAGVFNETSPFYCNMFKRICNGCGACGADNAELHRRYRIYAYQYLLTCGGTSFLCLNADERGNSDLEYLQGVLPARLEDRLDFAMKAAGVSYTVIDKTIGKDRVADQINDTLSMDIPIMMKLSDTEEWCVVTGIDKKANRIFGLDSRFHPKTVGGAQKSGYLKNGLFYLDNWYEEMQKGIFINGHTKPIELTKVILRSEECFNMTNEVMWKELLLKRIDAITPQNARSTAEYISDVICYIAQGRWDACEAFRRVLPTKTQSNALRQGLCELADIFEKTSGICVALLGELGVGPQTNFKPATLIAAMLAQEDRINRIKGYLIELFETERTAKDKLAEIKIL